MKLRTKFLLSFIVLIAITVFMISTVNYIVSVGAIKRNSSEFSEYLLGQIGINLEKRTADIEDEVFQQFRNSSLSEQLSLEPRTFEDQVSRDRYISDFMKELLFVRDEFLSVFILDTKGRKLEMERSQVRNYQQELLGKLNVPAVEQARGRALWFQGEFGTVFMARALYDIPTNKYVGIVAIGLDSSYLSSVVTNVRQLPNGEILFLNEAKEPLPREQVRSPLAEYVVAHQLYESGAGSSIQFHGKKYLLTVQTMDYEKWRIIQLLDVSQLTRGASAIQYWTVSTILVALAIAFLLAFFVSRSITENVSMLLQSMTSFTLDFKHKVIVPRSRDEIGKLAEKFNTMAEKINDLFNSVYREKLLKQKAEYRTLQFEYKALHAQMNPHFIYNTLESIHSMAKLNHQKEIGDMVYTLGQLLRESIGRKGDFISLEEEISFIRNYLSIHKTIYGDKIQIKYEWDETLFAMEVPKFILQPIVENAIIHGIEEKPGVGRVQISCCREEGDVLINVHDNGMGMDAKMIDRLLNPDRYAPYEGKNKHTNVGIISVHKRIRMLYGDGYGITIDSEPGQWTTVRIRLPLCA
jgi:two-component system sensor histidine kinase YesM